MAEKKFVKFCPHCSGTNIKLPPAGMDLLMSVPDYCTDCHALGVFPEQEVPSN